VELEHGVVGPSRGVEGDVLLERLPGRLDAGFVLGDGEEGRPDHVQLRGVAPRLGRARVQGGNDHLPRVAEGGDGVQAQAVAQLARQARHVRVDGGQVDRNV